MTSLRQFPRILDRRITLSTVLAILVPSAIGGFFTHRLLQSELDAQVELIRGAADCQAEHQKSVESAELQHRGEVMLATLCEIAPAHFAMYDFEQMERLVEVWTRHTEVASIAVLSNDGTAVVQGGDDSADSPLVLTRSFESLGKPLGSVRITLDVGIRREKLAAAQAYLDDELMNRKELAVQSQDRLTLGLASLMVGIALIAVAVTSWSIRRQGSAGSGASAASAKPSPRMPAEASVEGLDPEIPTRTREMACTNERPGPGPE